MYPPAYAEATELRSELYYIVMMAAVALASMTAAAVTLAAFPVEVPSYLSDSRGHARPLFERLFIWDIFFMATSV
jgi:hypothetical protein